MVLTPRRALIAAAGVLAVSAAPAAAQVTNGNQIFNGKVCVGSACGTDPGANGLTLDVTAADSPATRYRQAGGSFGAQTWDVGGNEASFFVRDFTAGSLMPFRIRPGAPTSALDLQADGAVSTVGVLEQTMQGASAGADLPSTGILAQLRTLAFKRYTRASLSHVVPEPAGFASAFGVGSGTRVAPADIAGVALAAVKELDARVSTLQLTPGPKGDAGARGADGAPGAAGATGAAGAPGAAAPASGLTAANARIARLERDNRKLTKSLSSLRKQIARLAKRP